MQALFCDIIATNATVISVSVTIDISHVVSLTLIFPESAVFCHVAAAVSLGQLNLYQCHFSVCQVFTYVTIYH